MIATGQANVPCPLSIGRKKPAHFREYSHPQGDSSKEGEDSDSLSDADGWPECPYGTACYRWAAGAQVEGVSRSSRWDSMEAVLVGLHHRRGRGSSWNHLS